VIGEISMPKKRKPPAPDAGLPRAIEAHRSGDLDLAERLYRRALERRPDDANALHFLGLLTHQRGDTAAAIELLGRATTRSPGYVDAVNNLGNLLRIEGRFAEAESAYRRAISLRPADADAHSNLGAILKARGHHEEAEASLARAIELDERHVPALTNMGLLLQRLGRARDAIAFHHAAVAYDPDHPDCSRVLGLAYLMNGDVEEAREVFRRWLDRDPGNPTATHLLAACSDEDAPERAADAYVRETFDGMAAGFDEMIADLGYRAPALVATALAHVWPTPRSDLDVLDAGCGTGLCAPFLRPHALALDGVDLSPGMLARAARRHLYDRLFEAELTRFLQERPAGYDAIVSADTLCYFGALTEVFEAAAGALRPGGRLLFTVEHAAPAVVRYRLEHHGRYSHERSYVAAELRRAGLTIDALDEAALRIENRRPVAGLVVTAGKP
jgi:predicted TPR repeat methyltransferase